MKTQPSMNNREIWWKLQPTFIASDTQFKQTFRQHKFIVLHLINQDKEALFYLKTIGKCLVISTTDTTQFRNHFEVLNGTILPNQ